MLTPKEHQALIRDLADFFEQRGLADVARGLKDDLQTAMSETDLLQTVRKVVGSATAAPPAVLTSTHERRLKSGR